MVMRWIGLIGCLCLTAPIGATPPIQAYGRLPNIDKVIISPDGANIAVVVGDGESREIQVRTTDGLKLQTAVAVGNAKVRGLQWAGPNHLLITKSSTAEVLGLAGGKREYLMAIDLNLTTRKSTALLEGIDRTLNTVERPPIALMINGRPTLFMEGISFPGSRGVLTLFRQDLENRIPRQMAVGNESTRQWLIDDQGRIAARVDYEQQSGAWSLWSGKDGHLVKTHSETAPIDMPSLEGFGHDKSVLLVEKRDGDQLLYREIERGGDHWSDPIGALTNADVIQDPVSRTTIGSMREGDLNVHYSFLDPADQRLWTMITRAFPNEVVRFESWSNDRSKIVLKVEGKKSGAAFYLLNTQTKHADWIADEYTGIGPDDIAEVQSTSYPAQDGLNIPAYLTLPQGVEHKALPLVVLVHGGPASRDEPGFNWWSQALASRGYAVFQPQFRGSGGFGGTFRAAGFGQWGRKMQTDVSDGVRYLTKQGLIDPARVCIVGGSYGGYAALAGVTLERNIYRCAVSLAGPSDLRRMLTYEMSLFDGSRNSTMRYWQQFMGAKSPGDPALDAISPYRLADHVTVPVLLIHGVDDTVVQYDQSRIMADALTRAGKKVQLVRLQGEDHWLSRGATRMQMLQAVSDFLDVNLPLTPARPAEARPTPVAH